MSKYSKYYIPYHIRRYAEGSDLKRIKGIVKQEFQKTFQYFQIDFDGFYRKLIKRDRAVLNKVGFFLHYYGRSGCKTCREQLNFLAGFSAIESVCGNVKVGKKSRKKDKRINTVVLFLQRNIPKDVKNEFLKKIKIYYKKGKATQSEKLRWLWLVNARNAFMHRADYINLANDVMFSVASNKGYGSKEAGIGQISFTIDEFIDLAEVGIINYLLTPESKRFPPQNYKLKIRWI